MQLNHLYLLQDTRVVIVNKIPLSIVIVQGRFCTKLYNVGYIMVKHGLRSVPEIYQNFASGHALGP